MHGAIEKQRLKKVETVAILKRITGDKSREEKNDYIKEAAAIRSNSFT